MPRAVALLIGSFAASALLAAQQGYVDSRLCADCHADIAQKYARTGMGRSFHSAGKNAPFPEFDGSSFLHAASGELFSFTVRDGVPWVRRSGTGTNAFEERVDYIIGSGNQAISYLHRTRDNKLTEFPVSWYPENGGHWAMSPAYDRPDHPGFSREVNYACMLCHNAYPTAASVSESPGETVFPEQLPEGIDCQRCHGPGQSHVDAAKAGKPSQDVRASIVNPARLNPERQSEVCLQCHLETTSSRLPASLIRPGRGVYSWRPGEPLADFILAFDHAPGTAPDSFELVSAPYRLAKSACVLTGGKPLACITCHDPHLPLSREESVRKIEGVCNSCHQPAIGAMIREDRHPARTDCVACHMPLRPAGDVIHASITDHWISKPHDDPPPAAEINAGNTPPYSGEVTPYYPKLLAQTPDNALALAIAQVQSNPIEALRRLDQLTERPERPERPEVAAEIGHAYLMLGQPQRALQWYGQALAKSPDNWSYLSGLGNAQQAAGHPELAAGSYARVVTLAPWENDALLSLGESWAKQSRFPDAVRTLRDAVSHNPESAAAFNDLGSTLIRLRDFAGAETALREAVRIQPEFASIRMNLADALIRQGKLREGQEQLEAAIRTGGRAETAESVWFSTLLATGGAEQALKAWKASFAAQVAGAHNNLGTVFASQNRPDDAIREYRLAVEGDPQSALAQFNLGVTLLGRGLKVEAIPYLKKAGESQDAGIRAAARSLLDKQ